MNQADAALSNRAGRVVVLDNDDQVRRMLCTALQVAGFETLEAATPTEAYCHLAGASPPEALVISVLGADTTGLQVLRYLRAHDHLDGVPIVFLSVQNRDNLRSRALTAGADWFAQKPCSLRELQQQVTDLVRKGRPRYRVLAGSADDYTVPG